MIKDRIKTVIFLLFFSYYLLVKNMEEYKLANTYLKDKNNRNNKMNSYLISFINRSLISALLVVACLCFIKIDSKNKVLLEENIYNKNISFARINKVYENLFGKIYPIEKIEKNTNVSIEPVFSEKLSYLSKEDYKEGIKLTVTDNYLVPILESGIVVYMGDKDNYGYTIIIEQVNGIDLWYVGVKNSNLKLYEYVEKGNMLGSVDKELYLFGQKDGKFVSYKEYLE